MALDKEESDKQPIKHLEIPINKFNDVAIPHHLNLLKKHMNNIKKYQNVRDWDRVYCEQVNASRVVKQLKQLLYELDSLRQKVIDKDIQAFDKLTTKAKVNTISAIKEYSDIQLNLPLIKNEPKKIEEIEKNDENRFDNRFLQLQAEKEELERQEACLEAWNTLQIDLQQLQDLFKDFSKIVYEQGDTVNQIESNIEDTQLNVHQAARSLEKAAKYKTMTYPLAGALIGTCLGGPLGLMAGLKIGGLAAVGGGFLGFTSGKIIKDKTQLINPGLKQIEAAPPEPSRTENSSNEEATQSPNKKNP